ncbi:MAG: DoxX family membrane protein [Bacteroidia bacterium]
MKMTSCNLPIAEMLIRSFAGILFMFQGYDKLFRIKIPGVIEVFRADVQRNHIPKPLLSSMAYYTSYVEFIGGFFLLLGFLTNYMLYALGLDLLLVGIAFSYMEPMWDMRHVFPRFILVIVLLLLPDEYRQFTIDHILNLK